MADETTAGPAPAGPPPTPELDKQHRAIEDGAHRVGEFLDWLESEGYVLARYSDGDSCPEGCSGLDPDYAAKEKLVAGFFGIDLGRIEAERQSLLDYLRGQQS